MKTLTVSILALFLAVGNLWAQQIVSINKKGSFTSQEQRLNSVSDIISGSRIFELNPVLQNFSQNNIGDTLLLDFFNNKNYKAVVKQVSKSYDGITGITTQIANTTFGYCYISISENSIALSAEIPQENKLFSVKKINGNNFLTEQTLLQNFGECSNADAEQYSSIQKVVPPTLPESNAPVTVDILLVYTPAAKAEAINNGSDINTMIDLGMQRANLVMSNSLTNVTLNLVHKQEVDYAESNSPNTDLNRLKDQQDGYADEVHALRSTYNADIAMLLLGESSSNVAGAGFLLNNEYGNAKSGFSVVKVKTIANGYTLIHEIGHNFGCGHHTDTDNNALYSYSHGFRGWSLQGQGFSSVMTYENAYGINYPRIPYFSDPNILFDDIEIGNDDANNAKTIRQTKTIISEYSNEVAWFDAFLQDITLSEGVLSPAFNAGVYNYSVDLPNSITSIDVQGITNSQHATVSGNITAMQLNEGSNIVELTVEDGWRNYLKTYTLTINRSSEPDATDINKNSYNKIAIYPNPATNELIIENLSLEEDVHILDISGRVIETVKPVCRNATQIIDLTSLPKGSYIIKAGSFQSKFVKK
jgi:hypothetical protein